jgi:uncharacterized protein YdhG (YjbR/CyaY superfamily)
MPKLKPVTIDEYINAAPPEAQDKLHEIRAMLKEVAPDAKEAIKWGQPVLEQGRILFAFSAFKNHLNFMPTRSTLGKFQDELAAYKTGHDTIQLPYDKPLPKALIQKIAKYRIKEVTQEGAIWMHKN